MLPLGSDRSKRLPGASSSPDDVEAGARKYAKRQRPGSAANQLRLRVRGGGATAAGALLALLLVAAGHRLYSHFLTPQVRQLAALEQQQDLAEQRRHGGLLRRSNAMSRRGAALADAARSAAQPTLQPSSPGSNCSCASEVRLADADRETLRKDIRSMVQALSDEHPWVAGVADALATEARPDVVSAGQQVSLPGLQPQRVADEAWGPQGATNIPGGAAGALRKCSGHPEGPLEFEAQTQLPASLSPAPAPPCRRGGPPCRAARLQ